MGTDVNPDVNPGSLQPAERQLQPSSGVQHVSGKHVSGNHRAWLAVKRVLTPPCKNEGACRHSTLYHRLSRPRAAGPLALLDLVDKVNLRIPDPRAAFTRLCTVFCMFALVCSAGQCWQTQNIYNRTPNLSPCHYTLIVKLEPKGFCFPLYTLHT